MEVAIMEWNRRNLIIVGHAQTYRTRSIPLLHFIAFSYCNLETQSLALDIELDERDNRSVAKSIRVMVARHVGCGKGLTNLIGTSNCCSQ
jgi:hypothetical protein